MKTTGAILNHDIPYYDLDPTLENTIEDVLEVIEYGKGILKTEITDVERANWERIVKDYTEFYENKKRE